MQLKKKKYLNHQDQTWDKKDIVYDPTLEKNASLFVASHGDFPTPLDGDIFESPCTLKTEIISVSIGNTSEAFETDMVITMAVQTR